MKNILRLIATAFAALAIHNASADLIGLYQFNGSTTNVVGGGSASLLTGAISYTTGITGQAISFDGNTLITAPQIGAGLSAFSISSWVNFNELGGWSTIVKNWGNLQYGTYHFGLDGGGDIFSNYLGTDQGQFAVFGGYPVSTGQWYNVVVTVGSSVTPSQRLYVNGVLVDSGSAQGTLNNNYALMSMGAKLDDAQTGVAPDAGYLNGYLDDLAFFNQELTSTQISQIYSAGLLGNSVSTLGFPETPYVNPNNAVPEPGTWAAGALLACGAAFMRWRKRAKVS